ncbi:Sodium/sulfate symporter [Gongronella butleri]|nr:Sodium/sulfate symporter [Gongronella butleri]
MAIPSYQSTRSLSSPSVHSTAIAIDPDECTCLFTRPEIKLPWWHAILASQWLPLIPPIVTGLVLWFGLHPTDDLTLTAIHILAVFISCILALMTTNMQLPTLVLSALVLLSFTKSFQCVDHTTGESIECRLCGEPDVLGDGRVYDCAATQDSFEHALEGFSSTVVWLIFSAFHLGKAVQTTQLGKRLSLHMIARFGQHPLGLGYAVVFSEILIAPFVPSNTARGGGIILPVVQSMAQTLGSTPTNRPAVGAFLMLLGSHANLLSASMFLTGMAPNPIVLAKCQELFPDLDFSFLTWLKGSIVPGLFCAIALPLILQQLVLSSSQEKSTAQPGIVAQAKSELASMGAMSKQEMQLCGVLVTCLCLWVTSGYTHLDATLVALGGLVALLHLRTISWHDVATNTHAWDTLVWLGGFITMAEHLSKAGASAFLGARISAGISDLGLPPVPCLAIAYFLTMFLFSSLSAHTVAFVGTFMEAGQVLGAKPMILVALLAYFGALGGCMTNFSTGTSAMYYAPGYVARGRWFVIGFLLAAFYITVYFTIGMAWWKVLGWH